MTIFPELEAKWRMMTSIHTISQVYHLTPCLLPCYSYFQRPPDSPGDQLLPVLTKHRHADPHQHLGFQFGTDIT